MAKAFTTDAVIEKIDIKKGVKTIKIKEIKLTGSQVDRMIDCIEDGGMMKLTIEPLQGNIDDLNDGKKKASGEKDED